MLHGSKVLLHIAKNYECNFMHSSNLAAIRFKKKYDHNGKIQEEIKENLCVKYSIGDSLEYFKGVLNDFFKDYLDLYLLDSGEFHFDLSDYDIKSLQVLFRNKTKMLEIYIFARHMFALSYMQFMQWYVDELKQCSNSDKAKFLYHMTKHFEKIDESLCYIESFIFSDSSILEDVRAIVSDMFCYYDNDIDIVCADNIWWYCDDDECLYPNSTRIIWDFCYSRCKENHMKYIEEHINNCNACGGKFMKLLYHSDDINSYLDFVRLTSINEEDEMNGIS